ncbi:MULTISPECIES: M20 family metallopeptidase [unclassified Haladaptatus]|uniref:M20 family metallopeptidase n=1 Tax=unclassified Haladaptatus TaxID=2622732 RepID=UPI0023E8D593|nr:MULTISPECIES: M20 family metallopeptidase [unclassified Haladaptatus]
MDFDPVAFLEDAVKTPSHEDIAEMRQLLVSTIEAQGFAAHVDDAGNTISTRETDEPGPHVVLNTHIDTVAPHVEFSRDGDIIRGRGSCDAKGPLTALLVAFFDTDLQRGKLTLAITPDEEVKSTGAAALDLDGDAYIVGEPTGLDVCNAAKGRFEGTITVRGENAHAAEPQSGVNAITGAGHVLRALETFLDRDDAPPVHEELGAATLEPTMIRGGTATNQIPAECEIVVDRRSVPPETSDSFEHLLETHLRENVPDVEFDVTYDFEFTDRPTPFLEAWETDPEGKLAQTLAAASGGAIRPFSAATEASYFAHDAPTVVFGPGLLADGNEPVAHSPNEYVLVSAVEAAAEAVTETVAAFLS